MKNIEDVTDTSSREYARTLAREVAEEVNVCEHGDHPAPPSRRFCSEGCMTCEGLLPPEGKECAEICGLPISR